MDAPFWFYDLIMKQGLLTWIKESEGTSRKGIIVPHMRGAGLEFFSNLGMNHRHILNGLLNAFVRQERTPALRILRPRVACQQDAAPCLLTIVRVIKITDGEIGDRAAAKDAFVFFPEATAGLEKYLGRGIVVQLADGALFRA